MLIVRHPRGHVVVTQVEHAAMSARLGEQWGNQRFGPVSPARDVRLAAEQHDVGWRELDATPLLDRSTGLPFSFTDLDFRVFLSAQIEGPRELGAREPYAGLLMSLHHVSTYSRPPLLGMLKDRGRRLHWFFRQSAALQAELRSRIKAADDEIDRNWRLVRTWDGLSLDLLFERAPCVRRAVPAADGGAVNLRVDRDGDVHLFDPWPFREDAASIEVTGRLLERRFSDEELMRAELAAAPLVTLTYRLAPAVSASVDHWSHRIARSI